MSERQESMVDRITRVLEAMDPSRPVTASEVARRSGLPMPTAHRIVNSLVEARLLERDESYGLRIGLRLWELATRSSSALSLRDVALPYMEELHGVVRQHTQLSVLDQFDVLYVERLTSRHTSSTNVAQAGSRLPVLSSAAGLVLTAFSPPDVQESILATAKITRFTPATVTDRQQLREVVKDTRRGGYAVAVGWIHPESAGLAVPILGADDHAIAALSITTPHDALDHLTRLPALSMTARVISRAVQADGEHPDPRLSLLKNKIRRATQVG